ncbi:GNAT family N-acetyltransferase [Streptomyces sp. NPDC014861]|uniref:GNAT family N-acetyltransferase n=1 Tax=Streptomyces sp. NPDC014861 TaxID=3364923 RepID=UPI0036F9AB1A
MNVLIEENAAHPGLPALLTAYHLATEAEKGAAVTGPADLPAARRAEAEDPVTAFAADTVLLAVAPETGLAAGCLVLKAGPVPEVKRVWVEPEARGRGLAGALMGEALRRAAAAGAASVRLTVWEWREGPLALYRKLGFELAASWDDRPGLLCLEKRLAPGDRVERLTPDAVRAHAAGGLAALLVDAVDDGASVGFLAPLDPAEAAAWWTRAAGTRDVWAAFGPDGTLTGAVTLLRTDTANGRHRGEIARLLVHRAARGRALGRRLLASAEAHAAATGLTLLVLDTRTDSPAERLYRGAGWIPAGTVPEYAADPDGTLRATTLYYKLLAA